MIDWIDVTYLIGTLFIAGGAYGYTGSPWLTIISIGGCLLLFALSTAIKKAR